MNTSLSVMNAARPSRAKTESPEYVTLEGNPSTVAHVIDVNLIRVFQRPVIRLYRSQAQTHRGTILLCPGGGYEILEMKGEGENTAAFLGAQGFDVAVLEYHISSGPQTRDLALADAIQTFRLVKSGKLGLHNERLGIMGYSAGAHLAARTTQNLGDDEKPDDLILIYPAYLHETFPGTVIPAVMPPRHPGRLFTLIAANDNPDWVNSCREFFKMWKGFDGDATLHILPDGGHGYGIAKNSADSLHHWPDLLKTFLLAKREISSGPNPAAVPVEGYSPDRHREKVVAAAKEKFDLIMVGDSITNNLENPEFQPVWNQFFAPRHALNLGYSGYRTENVLWNLLNGEIAGQSPKVITLMVGTNNVDEQNYPTRHTAGQLAGGIEAIVKLLREKCPASKILLLRSFPGCYAGPNPTSHRAILDRASELITKLADGKHVFFCDVNHVFLNLDGSLKQELMPDWLHPNPAGAKLWAQAMEPLLSELMGDSSLDTEKSRNTAIIPVSKLEEDGYDWFGRHEEILRIKDELNPDVVFLGDSITHAWGGVPVTGARTTGEKVLKTVFAKFRVLNLGFGWDRTQNLLWRLDHGELDRLHPRVLVLCAGTNNTSGTENTRQGTPAEIAQGVREICGRIRSKIPQTKIILMAVLPREKEPTDPRRLQIYEINRYLTEFAKNAKLTFVDLYPQMLNPDGTLPQILADDFCHPTEKGYQVWADAILPLVAAPQ